MSILDTLLDIKKFNSNKKALNKEDFKKYKSKYIKRHISHYGIPQGSAISAVFANVYMIEADEKINQLINQYNGLYIRYSDDFIVVIPQVPQEIFHHIHKKVNDIIASIPNLKLESKKTQIYCYNKQELISCNTLFLENVENRKNEIDYLGFTFNGKEVTIRDKTITKYYYRMYKKAKTIVKSGGYTSKNNKISCKNLYEKYSFKGANKKDPYGRKKGNFLTYVQRAEKIFEGEKAISRKTKRHMLKIRRVLDKVFIKQNKKP